MPSSFQGVGLCEQLLEGRHIRWGKTTPSGRLISSELLHQLPCCTLDNLNLTIIMSDANMAEDFLPDFLAGAYGFYDLDPGPIEFGIIFGADNNFANYSRCPKYR